MILFIIIVLAIILVLIVLILPANIVAKLSGLAVAVGLIFTGYTLYLNTQAQRKEEKRREIDRTHKYWGDVYGRFIDYPELEPMYRQIHMDNIPVNESAMFSMMMQVVEDIIESEEAGIYRMSLSWENTVKRWISHPDFRTYWVHNKSHFSGVTQEVIDSLIRRVYNY